MKRKFIEIAQELLYILMNHLVLLTVAITIVSLFNREKPYMLLWSVLWLIPVSFYFTRLHIHNFFLFFILHLIWPAVVVILPIDLLLKVIMMLFVIVYLVLSFRSRFIANINERELMPGEEVKKERELISPVFAVCIIGGLALIENFQRDNRWEVYYVTAILIYMGSYYVYHFIDQYLRFLQVNGSSAAHIPEQEIFTAGMKQTLIFTAGAVMLFFFSANIAWFSSLMSILGNGLLALLRMISSGKKVEGEVEIYMPQEQISNNDMDMFGEAVEPFFLWKVLENIMLTIAPILIILSVVALIIMAFRYLWKYFHAARVREDKIILTNRDVRESLIIEKEKKESTVFFSIFNNREKVRKIYKKRVLKQKNEIIGEHNQEELEYMTAKECCDIMDEENLKMIYEKARYSEEHITADDMKLVKIVRKV